jgi:hypothetical protein
VDPADEMYEFMYECMNDKKNTKKGGPLPNLFKLFIIAMRSEK